LIFFCCLHFYGPLVLDSNDFKILIWFWTIFFCLHQYTDGSAGLTRLHIVHVCTCFMHV
jgi:hypothetical protein